MTPAANIPFSRPEIKGVSTICVIHPFDPRGKKIGGIESHIRELIRSVPPDLNLVLIGIDEIGDLKRRYPQLVYFDGRPFEFVPLLTCLDEQHLKPATRLHRSLTLRFFLAFLACFLSIRSILRSRACTLEIQRFEFAIFSKLLNIKSVQMVHGEGSPDQPMDSLLKKYWFLHRLCEFIAMRVSARVLGVNSNIVAALKQRFSGKARDIDKLSVSVNSEIFAVNHNIPITNPFKIVFAGRLDSFKRPDLIFKVIGALRNYHQVPVEFHYIGTSDPLKFPDFYAIEDITILHGFCRAEKIAEIFGDMHAGLLLSEFEGMPVFALELMSVGRPLAALGLPQLEPILKEGVSGYMVARTRDDQENVQAVARALLRLRSEMALGQFQPDKIHSLIMPYTQHTQLKRLFSIHRQLLETSDDDQSHYSPVL